MPKVTVVVPNYNHARYLAQRIDSILAQTFSDFEVIIIDNASTDSSREVIESYLYDPRVRAIFNRRNNGSTFKQWNLGLKHASGEYIWFAESDDYAEPLLLETLVDRLDRHHNVGLATCQSWIVDEESRVLFSYLDFFKKIFPDYSESELALWQGDFVATGRDYCKSHLYHFNTIINASAVLLRRGLLEAVKGAPGYMKLSGDLMAYVNILLVSDIAFVASPLNYYRKHEVTSRVRARERSVPELLSVQRRINHYFALKDRDRTLVQRLADLLPASWEFRLRLLRDSISSRARAALGGRPA